MREIDEADIDIVAGEARAKVTRLNGEADAQVTRLKGEAQASVIRATGEAEAEAMRLKASAYQSYNEAAMLDRIVSSLPELVSAMIAVRPATAIAATLPPHPCGGSVIVTTNVVRIRTRTSP